MNEYLHNCLIKLIAPKSIMEFDYSIPYDINHPAVLSPKKVDELFDEALNFNLGPNKGLRKIINYFINF